MLFPCEGEIALKSYKHLYSKSLQHNKMHFAAHSHHPWPDCTESAHNQFWEDSVRYLDKKWEHIFGKIIPKTQENIAGVLNLSNPDWISFAGNTHEFVMRLFSCFPGKVKILTTDSEFHSFNRQLKRFIEAGQVEADIIPVEPYESFSERWKKAIQNSFDMIFTSQIYFNSGLSCPELSEWVGHVPSKTMIVIDGYHAFGAVPTDLKKFEDRIFYLAGGYKYIQSGEGVCFMVIPKESDLRPVNTGWFASFETLNSKQSQVEYSSSAMRFAGSTYNSCGCYRMNAVMEMLRKENLSTESIHERILILKKYFLSKVKEVGFKDLSDVIEQNGEITQSHYVTYRTQKANQIEELLGKNNITVDSREDRLRFGFGIYHDLKDIDNLIIELKRILK